MEGPPAKLLPLNEVPRILKQAQQWQQSVETNYEEKFTVDITKSLYQQHEKRSAGEALDRHTVRTGVYKEVHAFSDEEEDEATQIESSLPLYLKYTFGPFIGESQLDQTAKQPGKEETAKQYNLMSESQGFLFTGSQSPKSSPCHPKRMETSLSNECPESPLLFASPVSPCKDPSSCSSLPSEERGDGTKPPSEEREDRTKPPSEEREDRTKPSSEERGDRTKPPSEERGDRTKPPSEERGDRTKPASEERGDRTKPSSEERGDRTKPPSEERGDRTKPAATIPASNSGSGTHKVPTNSPKHCGHISPDVKTEDSVERPEEGGAGSSDARKMDTSIGTHRKRKRSLSPLNPEHVSVRYAHPPLCTCLARCTEVDKTVSLFAIVLQGLVCCSFP